MATDVAVLIARLEADVRDFDKDLKKASKRLGKLEDSTRKAGKATDKTTSAFGGMGKMMGVVFAGAAAAGAIKFFKGAVDASSDLNESINAVNVVFGESAEGVKALGENAADSLGLANAEFNSLAVGFSAFVEKIAGPGGDVVKTLEDLTTRAADFASVMNIDVAEAATIFKSALAGETESIRKFGVDVSAAAVTQQALADGLADSSSELSEQDKILSRYKLIMDQTEKTAGDFANTSDEWANALRRLSSKLEDAKAKIGDALIPVLEDLLPLAERFLDWLIAAAVELGVFTGSISKAEAAMRLAKLAAGDTATNVEILFEATVDLNEELNRTEFKDKADDMAFMGTRAENVTDEFKLLIGAFELTGDEIDELKSGGFDELADEMGISEEAVQELIKAIDHDLNVATNAAKRHLKDDLEDALNDVEGQADDTADAVDNLAEAILAAVDPVFAAVRAEQDLIEARAATLEAQAEAGRGSAEHEAAVLDELEASLKLDAATETLELTMGEAGDALIEAGKDAGFTTDKLEILRGAMNDVSTEPLFTAAQIERAKEFRDIIDELANAVPRIVTTGPSGFSPVPPGVTPLLHQGGIVPGPAGADVPIVAQAGEQIIPAAQVAQGGSGGGDVNITIEGDLTEPVFEDLQRELILESIGRFVETR